MQLLQQIHAIEAEVAALLDKQDKAFEDYKQQFISRSAQLIKRRHELVSGKEPTKEELHGYDRPSASTAATDSAGPKHSSKGVPFFWLNVICNQDTLASHVTSRDRRALEYCEDVRAVRTSRGAHGIELVFAPNPFFSNRVLRRMLGSSSSSSGSNADEGTAIDWKDGRNLTVREVAAKRKKAKKGGKGGGREAGAGAGAQQKRLKGCPSFFRFFAVPAADGRRALDPTRPHAEEGEQSEEEEGAAGGDARAAAKRQRDVEIGDALLEQVVPKALHIFMSGPLQTSACVESGEEDEEEEDYAMVSAESGAIEALPPRTQAALHALKHNQAALDALAGEVEGQRLQLARTMQEQLLQLYTRRRSLLLSADGSRLQLPRFWLRALRALDTAALAITPADARLLAGLVDVRFMVELPQQQQQGQQQERHGTLELEFLPSTSSAWGQQGTVLRKRYTFTAPSSGSTELSSSALRIISSEATAPQWADYSRDPTQKRGRDGKLRPCASFFCLFKPGAGKYAFGLTGDAKHAEAEAHDLEVELLLELQALLLPRATALYEQITARGDDEGDDGTDDSDDGSDHEGEGDAGQHAAGEGAAAGFAARAHARRKAKSWGMSMNSMILLGLMLMVLSAQVLVFFL